MQRDVRDAAEELRRARLANGLTIRHVASLIGVGRSTVLRTERGGIPAPRPMMLARHAAAVGLRARIRLYPGDGTVRDAGQVALIRRFRERIGQAGGWAFEVPIPLPGDQRALDAVKATHANRRALREAAPAIADTFPGRTRSLLATLNTGGLPSTNGVIVF
jgi:transcriptional regulator with XRE-family HTH domain